MSAAPLRAGANSRDGRFELVLDQAEIDDDGAFLAGQRGERKTVGIDDLPRPGLLAGRHQFVAGREQRHFRAAMQRHERMVHASEQRQIARAQPVTRREQRVAAAKSSPWRRMWRPLLTGFKTATASPLRSVIS